MYHCSVWVNVWLSVVLDNVSQSEASFNVVMSASLEGFGVIEVSY